MHIQATLIKFNRFRFKKKKNLRVGGGMCWKGGISEGAGGGKRRKWR